ncbi:MAG: hypothetical protein HY421_00290 [Candidatus Kerfeldbacteria bacterium]|nr:hypothetical protein [Candidatus Kerfeldbacteria bacterium]
MNVPPTLRKLTADLLTTYFRFVLMAAAALVAVLGYWLLIKPQFESVRLVGILALQNENERLRDRQAYLDRLTAMVDRYRQVKAAQAIQSQRMLPLEPDQGNLFLTIQALARQVQMQLDSVSVTKGSSLVASQTAAAAGARRSPTADASAPVTTSSGTVQIQNVSFSLSGPFTYESFKQLLRAIERSVRVFDLESITFKPVTDAAGQGAEQASGTTTYSLSVKAYYLDTGAAS